MVIKNNFLKKSLMILVVATSIFKIDLLYAGKDDLEDGINALLAQLSVIPEGQSLPQKESLLPLNEFLNGFKAAGGIDYESMDALTKLLKDNAGFFARALAKMKEWVGNGNANPNTSSFELKLAEKLGDLGQSVRIYVGTSSNPTFVKKQQWLNLIALVKSYLENKPPSRWWYVTTPAQYVFYPVRFLAKEVFSKPIAKAWEYITALMFILTLVAIVNGRTCPTGFIDGFTRTFSRVADKLSGLLLTTETVAIVKNTTFVGYEYAKTLADLSKNITMGIIHTVF